MQSRHWKLLSGALLVAALFTPAWAQPAAPAAPATTAAASSPRSNQSFNADWRFYKGDAPGAEAPAFNDSAWRSLSVPHDWSIEGPYDESAPVGAGGGYLPSGISWYRKTFTLPADAASKRVSVDFDGIMANSEVWINGQPLGRRPYGYVPIVYDLTGKLNFGPGQTNVLAVKTDTTVQPASRWYTGQGIYRKVWLDIVQPVHIQPFGVFVTTPQATAEQAGVSVQAAVKNNLESPQQVTLQVSLVGPDGQVAATGASAPQTLAPGATVELKHDLTVANPKLWNVADGQLYQAVTKIVGADGRVWDDLSTNFGIRTFAFRADTGFWLNGQNIPILGVCLHHDGGAVGAAVPDRVWERRLEIMRELGVNAIRTAHNPMSRDFLDLCDRMGFLVMNETFDTWRETKGFAPRAYNLHFDDWWEADTRDTVLRDRNHPSIVIWSVGNEIRADLNSQSGRDTYLMQASLIKRLDPTRPVTMGLFRPQETGHIPAFTDLLDVVGINYRPAQLANVAASGRPVIGTEETHELSRWAPHRDNPAIPGTFLWTGIDYLGETGPTINGWPYVVSSNNREIGFGLVEHTGYLRPRAYQRQSWWSEKPMVHVARYTGHGGGGTLVSDWTPNDPDTFDVARVEVFSNAEAVELFLNNESLGYYQMPADGRPLVYGEVSFAPGALRAVARTGGQDVATHELRTAGAPARIVLEADRSRIANEFDDVSHVTARIADANGITNPNAETVLRFQVSGPGKLLALSTGDRTSHQPFQATERRAYHGEVQALVGATADSGTITLTATGEGLEPATLTLQAAPAPAGR